jgi:hypothetical protein
MRGWYNITHDFPSGVRVQTEAGAVKQIFGVYAMPILLDQEAHRVKPHPFGPEE